MNLRAIKFSLDQLLSKFAELSEFTDNKEILGRGNCLDPHKYYQNCWVIPNLILGHFQFLISSFMACWYQKTWKYLKLDMGQKTTDVFTRERNLFYGHKRSNFRVCSKMPVKDLTFLQIQIAGFFLLGGMLYMEIYI